MNLLSILSVTRPALRGVPANRSAPRSSCARAWPRSTRARCVSRFLAGLLPVVAAMVMTIAAVAAEIGRTFATPEAAVEALSEAVRSADRAALRRLFGPASDSLVAADQVQATNELAEFTVAFQERHHLVAESDTRRVLEVGSQGWPFPIPLVRSASGEWFFDTEAGQEEVLNRRIGRNELETLEVMRAYVDAQREYASRDRDGDRVREFAAKLESSPGIKDGLYWPPDLDGEISPLGPLVAHARAEGYSRRSETDAPQPFHGYLFRVLTRQGRHAPGGSYRYVINGNMIGGFALVAWPAQYGESGIMTFLVNQEGVVYQKDLGIRTARTASRLDRYDPDPTWEPGR